MDVLGMEIPFVGIILIVFAGYFLLIVVMFWICVRIQPQKFIQAGRAHMVDIEAPQISSYLDCSGILKCCPCTDISFRQLLKACCCDAEKFRRSVNCECIRPAVHGSQHVEGINLVCCQVGGNN